MVGKYGRRKWLTIFIFLFPTILSILVFNVYPILLNTYVSFTNRNKFRPNPDCSVVVTGLLDPLCWPKFRENAPTGLGKPYGIIDPVFKNYQDLFGKIFEPQALLSLAGILLCFVPLVAASRINKHFDKQLSRTIPSGVIWLAGLVGVVLLMLGLNISRLVDTMMQTGDFLVVVLRTLIFVVIRVPLTFVVGLVLALILNNPNLRGKTFFRVMLFIPWGASSLAILISLIWQFFFRQQGVINQVLNALFGIQGPIWLNNPIYAFGIIILADLWFSYPFFMVSILGALQSIPVELYEASDVDGAGWWTQLTAITLPLIRPAVLPATVLTSITAFQMFGTAYAITGGGPQMGAGQPGATEFVMVYAFKQIFQTQNFGRATAFAVIIFIMLFGATLYSMRVTRMTKGAFE